MRTYLILKEKAKQFDADPVVREILAHLNTSGDPESEMLLDGGFTKAKGDALKARTFDADALSAKSLPYEKLDQRTFEILHGVA